MATLPGERRADPARVYLRVLVLVGVVCAGFAAAASWTVLGLLLSGAFDEEPGFGAGMLIKALAFSATAVLGAAWILRRSSEAGSEAAARSPEPTRTKGFRWELIAIVSVSVLLFFPNLNRFPAAAPDEMHHLIVARNFGVHGAYASGLPPDGLVYFDYYDSVGPTVIAPVAAALRIVGVDVSHGRYPMALFSLAFPVAVYFLFAGAWGRAAGTLAALTPLGAFGTVYLGRTLYGEVPALTLLIAGLLLWRRSIASRSMAFAMAAGLLFGLAVVTKTFLALAVFAFAGVWLYDRATARCIGWRTVIPTAVGAVMPLAAWSLVRFLERDLIGEQPSMVVYYRQMLVFGLEPLIEQMPRFLDALPVLGVSLLLLALAVPRVFRGRMDSALAVLFLVAAMFAFWWIAFTPMHIPRYLWYTAAISAALGGGLLGVSVRTIPPQGRTVLLRSAPVVLAALLLLAYGLPLSRFAYRVYAVDQAAPDRALVEYVESLAADARLVTTYWPVERVINFATERPVEVLGAAGLGGRDDALLIVSDRMEAPGSVPEVEPIRFGHYRVYEGGRPARLAGFKGE